jgi:transaldolase
MELPDLKIKIFADGADLHGMLDVSGHPLVRGFTTNPTLMRKAGVEDYASFAREAVRLIPDQPISFEVLSDDFDEMEQQAFEIASWGENVYVKVPVMNARGESARTSIARLAAAGVRLNITALMTLSQLKDVAGCIGTSCQSYVSIFAGRIADTGRDPVPIMAQAVELLRRYPNIELIWASPRELLNIFQADAIGCHVITVTNDLLRKLDSVGKDLCQFSLETVQMFQSDAAAAGYHLETKPLVTSVRP